MEIFTKMYFAFAALSLSVACFADVALVKDGKPVAEIVLVKDAIPATKLQRT